MTTSIVKFQLRRDISTNWTSSNPTLSPGEPGVELDTGRMKLGTGTGPTGWNYLSYVGYTGETGHTGHTGETGHTGHTGPTGLGFTGPTGLGFTGPTGLGFTGPTGPSSNTNYTNTRPIVAVGRDLSYNNSIITSTDGITWTKIVTNGIASNDKLYSIKWNTSVWIVCGTNFNDTHGVIYTSTDAITWINRTVNSYGPIRAIDWNGTINRWVVIGTKNGSKPLYSDNDGVTWTPGTYNGTGSTTFQGYCIAWNGIDKWIIGGLGAGTSMEIGLLTSSDGETWTNLDTGIPNTITTISSIIWTGSLWIAVGIMTDLPPSTTRITNIITSPDGIVWSNATSGGLISNEFYPQSIAWNGSKFVLGGILGANIISTSTNGTDWSTANITIPNTFIVFYSNVWSGSLWIAVGGTDSQDKCIFTSIDGQTWTERNGISGTDPKELRDLYSTNVWLNNPITLQDTIYKIENELFKKNSYKLL
jgi:hypothetical protein